MNFLSSLLQRAQQECQVFLEGVFILVLGDKALSYIDRLLGPGSFMLLGVVALLYF